MGKIFHAAVFSLVFPRNIDGDVEVEKADQGGQGKGDIPEDCPAPINVEPGERVNFVEMSGDDRRRWNQAANCEDDKDD